MPKLGIEKKARISALLDAGFSTRSVATKEKISQSTVARLKKRIKLGQPISDLPRSGRPRLFSKRGERKIVRLMSSGKYQTAKAVNNYLKDEKESNTSTNTIRRIFRRAGFAARIKAKKPFLKPEHKIRRLEFARKFQNWKVEDWMNVIWSDRK